MSESHTEIEEKPFESTLDVLRRGVATSPELLRGIGVTSAIGVAFAGGSLVIPIVIQQAIDRGGISSGEVRVDTIVRLAVAGVVLVVLSELLGIVLKRRLVDRAEVALRGLRVKVFDHVHQLSLEDHNQQSTGVLLSRVTSDVDAINRFADWGLLVWIVSPLVISGVFVTMAVYSWQLALLGVVCFAPAYFVFRWVRSQMAAAHSARQGAVGSLLGAFTELLNGAEVVRAYRAEQVMAARIEEISEHRYRSGLRANVFSSGVYVVGDLIGSVMLSVLVVVGFTQRDALGLTAGELVAVISLSMLLNAPVARLGETINNAQQAVAGWRKVLDLLDHRWEITEAGNPIELPSGPLSVELSNVHFSYRDGQPVLSNLSVRIDSGTRVAVVGKTGSGKSTFARIISRLAEPDKGEVSIGGIDLAQVSDESRRRTIRIVPQDGFLFNTTVRENIGNGLDGATDEDVDRAIELLGLSAWIESLTAGLDTEVGERGSLLSVGERQLVSFARAAVADPGLLILDEATSSVDPQTDIRLTDAIERLSRGRTVISIAHRLSTAEAADVVLVFDAGELVEQGSSDELIANDGPYARLQQAWKSSAAGTASRATSLET